MNKRIISAISFALVVVLLCIALCGCDHTPQEVPTQVSGKFDFAFTNADVVKNGTTDYKVVIPSEASDYIKLARDDFVHLFKKATGITLQVLDDTNLSHNADNKYISLGKTTLLATSGITVDKKVLGNDGIRIVTKDNTVFIVGGTDSGTLYGVYDYMYLNFHYEQYSTDCMEIDTGVTDLKLGAFDITDIPDFALRAFNYGMLASSSTFDASMYGYRMRMNKQRGEYMMPIFKDFKTTASTSKSTNADYYLPYETYHDQHPKWFSDNCLNGENQFCYTAHGDASEYELMVEECAKKIEFSLQFFTPQTHPDMNVVTLTMQDNFRCCTCPACMAMKDHYGAESGAVCIFINAVADKVDEWMAKDENAEFRRDDLHIIFFAYNNFEQAPTHYDSQTGTFVSADDKVVLRDNVGVYLAILNNLDYQQSYFGETNSVGKEPLDAWSTLTDFIYYWNYDTNFKLYPYFYDSFNYFTDEMYKYVNTKHVAMYFSQGQETSGETGICWNNLKVYLNAKLSWDTSLTTEELTDKWFDAMFRDASTQMKQLFYAMRIYNDNMLQKYNFYKIRSNYNMVNSREYWNLSTLQGWVQQCDQAKASVAKYQQSNPELYEQICKHIEAEAFSPMYIIVTLYNSQLSVSYKKQLIDRLYYDISWLNLQSQKESEHGSTVSEILKSYM